MASTLALKRRIKTAQNVSKTTKAMQMIAASKLKRGQNATVASKPYVTKLQSLTKSLTERVGGDINHPYMDTTAETGKTLLLIFSPDKGLCGGLVSNLLREFVQNTNSDQYIYVGYGKKIEHYLTRMGKNVLASFPFGTTIPTFDAIYPLSSLIQEYFVGKKVDRVQVLSTDFVSLFTQKPSLKTILPLKVEENVNQADQQKTFTLFEPNAQALIPPLFKHYLEMVLYQHLLENYVSEQAARMMAMQNATDNAKDIISALTLEYNKARQQKITNEILDISSAALFAYA